MGLSEIQSQDNWNSARNRHRDDKIDGQNHESEKQKE